MSKKLTLLIDDAVYEGLHRVAGRDGIDRFIENLARPHVVPNHRQDRQADERKAAWDTASERDQPALAEKLLGMVHASWMSQVICVAAELGVADLLAGEGARIDDLARATGCPAPTLQRLMRALSSLGLCRAREGETHETYETYELTAMGALLRADAPDSIRSWAIWWGRHLWPVWGQLGHSIRTGESARKHLTGATGFAHLERDAALADLFNSAMAELSRGVAQAVVRGYDFSRMKRIVDVGGGQGELLEAIVAANPGLYGVVFDLPHAIDSARRTLARSQAAHRCEVVAGSFFDGVPQGADAYLLKSVIDDWDDERAGVILANCRRAMMPDARLLLIEPLLPADMGASPFHQAMARVDLNMLVTHGAAERTEAQLRALLDGAGLRVARIIATTTTYNIIEAAPL